MSNEKDNQAIFNLFYEFHDTDNLGLLRSKLVDYVTTIRQEERRAAFKQVIEIASRHKEHSGYTLHQFGEESLDCRNVIWRELEAAANETREDKK